MRDIVTSVCVPQAMVSKELVDNYQADGIEVTTFSYIDWDHIKSHRLRRGSSVVERIIGND